MAKEVREQLEGMIDKRWKYEKDIAEKKEHGSAINVKKPSQAGLCVSIYEARVAVKGTPGYDLVYFIGFATTILQLGIAAIPCGIFGDWGIFLITSTGILLSFATGALPQWAEEKWACREKSLKKVILTRGNGSQHAIVVLGQGNGLDLEDLAAGQTNVDASASWTTRVSVTVLATLWVLLLITAAGLKENTWFLLAIGGVGILQNIFVSGWRRDPEDYGIPLTFLKVIGKPKVMDALIAVEEEYPNVGESMRPIFFPGKLRPDEELKWEELAKVASDKDKAAKMAAENRA
jgi:hypothetical protein